MAGPLAGEGASHGGTRDEKPAPRYTLAQFKATGELGAGSFGTVRRVEHQDTGEVFAMKVLEKERVVQRGLQEQLRREVLTQLRVRHSNVVRLHYYFEDTARIYCLLEYADGGQLFAYLRNHGGCVPEPRAAALFSDTAAGLAYLHSLRVAHRDLKPENVLLFGAALRAKIGDFGWCVEISPEQPERKTFCGTLDYVAPEMLANEPHDTGVDLWALGVLLYELLLARSPFAGDSQKDTMERICGVRFEVPPRSMSAGPEALIRGLLVRHKKDRLPLARVLQDPWVLSGSLPSNTPDEDADSTRAVVRGAAVGRVPSAPTPGGGTLDHTRVVPRRDAQGALAPAAPGAAVARPAASAGHAADDLDATVVPHRGKTATEVQASLRRSSQEIPDAGGGAVVAPLAERPGAHIPPASHRQPPSGLKPVAEDAPLSLQSADARLLAPPGTGDGAAGGGSDGKGDFWVVSSVVVSSRPRPKMKSGRRPTVT